MHRATVSLLLAAGTLLALQSCGSRDRYIGVEIRRGTVAERAAVAREFATGPRRDWLIRKVKDRYPVLSDSDTERLYLTWKATVFMSLRGRGQKVRVFVIVGSRGTMTANVDEVLSYCGAQIAVALEENDNNTGRMGRAFEMVDATEPRTSALIRP